MAVDLLAVWVGKSARRAILARHPEVGQVCDACAALIEAQDATTLDGPSILRAGRIARAFRAGIGYVQETETLDIEARCALNLVKRAVRDGSLVLPWPGNAVGAGMAVKLDQAAADALDRLGAYDPLGGTGTYLGNMVADLAVLATGIRVERA